MTAEDREIARTAPAWWLGRNLYPRKPPELSGKAPEPDCKPPEAPLDIELPSPKFVDNFTFEVAWSEDQVRALVAAERARADAAERDARRYRFLRSIGDEQLRVFGHYAGPALDAAIDATTEGVQHGEAK